MEAMKEINLPKVPEEIKQRFIEITNIIQTFSVEHLNDEYYELAIKLAAKLARKRPSPFLGGTTKTWAAGIVHALGIVNFLFDKSKKPYISSADLCNWFDLGQSTISGKSKIIRDMFKITYFNTEWVLPSKVANHPMTQLRKLSFF